MTKVYREYHYKTSEQLTIKAAGYGEITYTDHYTDGRGEYMTQHGTEDFSIERWNRTKKNYRVVYVPTGRTNKAGNRTWEYFGTVYARTTADACKIARLVMKDREISIRAH